MTVAAVIVNYNSGSWLQRCVKHVLDDDHISKIFVVDNASSDDSVSLLEDECKEALDSQLVVIRNSQNRGFGIANNQVIDSLVNAADKEFEFVLLINPDCELKPGVIKTMLPYFEQDQRLGMASCLIENTDGSVQTTCRRRFPTPYTALVRMLQLHRLPFFKFLNFDMGNEPMPETLQHVEAISGAFMLARVEAVSEVGSFDEAYFMHCEDLDWCKRFQLKGWKVGFVPEVSVVHEKGVSSRARPVGVLWNLHQGMLYFFDKFYSKKYNVFIRFIVKIGVYSSFVLRAVLNMIKNTMLRFKRGS